MKTNKSLDYCSGASVFSALLVASLALVLYLGVSAPNSLLVPAHAALVLLFLSLVALSSLAVLCLLGRCSTAASQPFLPWSLPPIAAAWSAVYSLLSLLWLPSGDLGSLQEEAPGIWLVRNSLLVAAAALPIAYGLFLRDRWLAQLAAESSVRLEALQARIRPHFLFNALNTIASLIPDRPERAEQATLDLADLLRAGLASSQAHRLGDELELIRRYLRLEALRLEDRLGVEWQLDEDLPLDQTLPPLLLQPLVENAIVHGISRRAAGGTLRIEGRRIRFGRLRFIISNPLPDADSRPADGNRTALDNIRQRLALAYEERYGLKTWIDGDCFKAELTIPVS